MPTPSIAIDAANQPSAVMVDFQKPTIAFSARSGLVIIQALAIHSFVVSCIFCGELHLLIKIVLSDCVNKERPMAKTIATRKRIVRRDWTRADIKELRQHSRDKTPVKTISRALKRTPGALRQKARALGIPLGHRRPKRRRV